MNSSKIDKIRVDIVNLTKKYFNLKLKENEFLPGKNYVNYAGRVFDFNEGVNLINSSLDFWLTAGDYHDEFEKKMENYLGVKHSILTNSGSSANLLALTALTSDRLKDRQLKPGDEVITVAAGFPTTINPIYQNNLIPVFCDIDLDTYNIKVEDIEKSLSSKTKAIILAHTLGNPFNIDIIIDVAKKYNLWIIEDNCDALGSRWDGQLTGTFGDISTQSFYPPHHITMGEGGSLNTNNSNLKKIIESFRDWGRDCWCSSGADNTCGNRFNFSLGNLPKGYDHKYIYSHIGYNLKITDLQASIGVAQIDKIEYFGKARRENHKYFFKKLSRFRDYILLPSTYDKSDPSWFGFLITIKKNSPFTRNDLVQFLEANKVATRMLFGGNLIRQPAYIKKEYILKTDLENTDYVMSNSFWIGVYPGITSLMREYVIEVFNKFFVKNKII